MADEHKSNASVMFIFLMTFSIHLLRADNLEPGLDCYIKIFAKFNHIAFLITRTLKFKTTKDQTLIDPDERRAYLIPFLRAAALEFHIYKARAFFDDDQLFVGTCDVIPLDVDAENAVQLKGIQNKKQTSTLYIKILPTVPRNVFADWHLRDHHLYISLLYEHPADAFKKPSATLELLHVDIKKHKIRYFGYHKKPQPWIKYESRAEHLSENGPTNVFRICTKRCPKFCIIPIITVNKPIEGKVHVLFWSSSKEQKKDKYRLLTQDNLYPALILDDVVAIDGPGKYSAGHILMQEPCRPPQFVAYTTRRLDGNPDYIDFVKHYGPNVFTPAPDWKFSSGIQEEY